MERRSADDWDGFKAGNSCEELYGYEERGLVWLGCTDWREVECRRVEGTAACPPFYLA
jgi:hypothetical protein